MIIPGARLATGHADPRMERRHGQHTPPTMPCRPAARPPARQTRLDTPAAIRHPEVAARPRRRGRLTLATPDGRGAPAPSPPRHADRPFRGHLTPPRPE